MIDDREIKNQVPSENWKGSRKGVILEAKIAAGCCTGRREEIKTLTI